MIFDTHAHYDDEAFSEDKNEVLSSLREQGVTKIVNSGASLKTSEQTLKLCEEYDFIYGAIGVHPSETEELTEENFKWLEEHVNDKKVVAIGEIGLDYYWDTVDKETQRYWFKKQLELAVLNDKPVVIHSRDAAEETLVIMKQVYKEALDRGKKLKGVIHCFSYSMEIAKEYVKMGFYLGIGGVLTFKNARKLKEVVEEIPLSSLVLETDCPYLAPVPHRGERNHSGFLSYVVNEIADLKNITAKEVQDATYKNAMQLYELNE